MSAAVWRAADGNGVEGDDGASGERVRGLQRGATGEREGDCVAAGRRAQSGEDATRDSRDVGRMLGAIFCPVTPRARSLPA